MILLVSSVRAAPSVRPRKPPPLAILGKKRIVLLKKIRYGTWRYYKIHRKSYPILKAVAKILRNHPRLRVRIESHADGRGARAYNLRFTRMRAREIKRILVKMGIKPHRLKAVGMGNERLLVKKLNPKAYAKNRRIEFHLIPKKKKRP